MTDKALSSFLFGDVLPQALFKRVTLQTAGPGEDRVELKLMFRNVIESEEAVNFFEEEDIYKHFVAFVYASYDKRATDFLLENYNSLTKMEVQESGMGGLAQENYNFEFEKVSNLFDPATSSEQFDDDGNRVILNAKNIENFTKPSNDHLTYFVVIGVDISDPSFLEEFDIQSLDGFEGLETSLYNKPIIFEAIENKKITSSRLTFVTMDDKIWVGDVAFDRDISGNLTFEGVSVEEETPLILKRFPLNIVQEFRDPDKFDQPLQISSVPKDLTLLKEEIKFLNNDKMDVDRKETYVSNVYLSRDLSGKAKLLFSVDYLNLIKNKSLFGNLVNEATFEEFADQTRISSLKVLRRRVKKEKDKNKLNSSFVASNMLFDEEEIEEVVVLSADNSNSTAFIPQNTSNNQLDEVILNFSNDRKIRTFNAVDAELNLKTFGTYQYGVEIQIEDNISIVFDQILLNLEQLRQRMDEYYNDSLSYSYEGDRREKHYDSKTETFTPRFKKFVDEKYPGISFVGNTHTEILNFYRLLGSADYSQEIINSFNSMVDPDTGSPKGILFFINFVDLNISLLERILKQNVPKTRPKSNLNFNSANKTASEKGGGQRSIDFRTFFTTEFADVEDSKFVGIDYFNEESKTTTGLNVFDVATMDAIIENNNDIYYDDGGINYVSIKGTQYQFLGAKYSFLSPLVFHFGSSFVYETENLNEGKGTLILENVVNYNLTKDSETFLRIVNPQDSDKDNNQVLEESLLREIYARFGVTFPSLQNTNNAPIDALFQVDTAATNQITAYGAQIPVNPLSSNIAQSINQSAFGNYQDPNYVLRSMLKTFLENNSFSKSGETFNLFARNKSYNKIRLNPAPTPLNVQDLGLGSLQIAPNPVPLEYDMNTEEIYNPIPSITQDNAVIDLMKNKTYYTSLRSVTTNNRDKLRKTEEPDVPALINRLPNQVKSLFAWKDGSNAVNDYLKNLRNTPGIQQDIIKDKTAFFVILYTMLKKVEYLAGYETLEEGNKIKNEKWEVLDNIAIDNLSTGRYLLCRIVDYNPEELGLSKSDILEMPIVDKYFLVRKEFFQNPLL